MGRAIQVADCAPQLHGHLQPERHVTFCGEEPIARVMKSIGYSDEEARTCIIWGCYEWGVRDSANTSGAGYLNLLKSIEQSVKTGATPDAGPARRCPRTSRRCTLAVALFHPVPAFSILAA